MTIAARFLATWFGIGLIPFAPGTWGSLAAVPLAWALSTWGGPWILLGGAVVVFTVGSWAAGTAARAGGQTDPGEIVIDEVAGLMLALVPVSPTPLNLALGFILFRVFDIWKPWPVSYPDRYMHNGVGIMLDDVLAGIYAALCLWLLSKVLP